MIQINVSDEHVDDRVDEAINSLQPLIYNCIVFVLDKAIIRNMSTTLLQNQKKRSL